MARPKSTEKLKAIMDAALRVIYTQGLSAPTATIAQEACISNGSLFTYFETKSDLINQLFFELKSEMAVAALKGVSPKAPLQEQALHVWTNWMNWAITFPEKRRVLALLTVCDDITPKTRIAVQEASSGLMDLMAKLRAKGSFNNTPMPFVYLIMNSLAEATMDYIIKDPVNAKKHCQTGFEALWRAIS